MLKRCGVVLVALAVIYWRTSATFTNPQFWAEDIFFFHGARVYGWASLAIPLAGYFTVIQYTVAVLAGYFSPVFAPAIYNYTAVCLTLVVIWLVTSPRFDMPMKPLLAIAVVIVKMCPEIGTLCNIQWILPIGTFAILFMRASRSPSILAGEAVYLGFMSVSGPFSIFLAPMFAWRAVAADPAEKPRLVLFAAIVGIGAIIQALGILLHPQEVMPAPYPWTMWVSIPLAQIMTTFGVASRFFSGMLGVAIGMVCVAIAAVLACMRPYRTQKIFMLVFALLVVAGGLYKFRNAVASQAEGHRYFYAASVFALWFICCLSDRPRIRAAAAAFVLIAELIALPIIRDWPRISAGAEWRPWTNYISSGLALTIPTSPDGWYLGIAASRSGPLKQFASWIGENIRDVAVLDPTACTGTSSLPQAVRRAGAADVAYPTEWRMSGVAWDRDRRPILLVAIADEMGRILGFGFTGFASEDPNPTRSGWISVYKATSGNAQAFGIVDNGKRVCPIAR